jgi:hypothetical protein
VWTVSMWNFRDAALGVFRDPPKLRPKNLRSEIRPLIRGPGEAIKPASGAEAVDNDVNNLNLLPWISNPGVGGQGCKLHIRKMPDRGEPDLVSADAWCVEDGNPRPQKEAGVIGHSC